MPKGAFQIKYLTGIFKLTNAFGSFWYLIFFYTDRITVSFVLQLLEAAEGQAWVIHGVQTHLPQVPVHFHLNQF